MQAARPVCVSLLKTIDACCSSLRAREWYSGTAGRKGGGGGRRRGSCMYAQQGR